jgi:hypothetical protein
MAPLKYMPKMPPNPRQTLFAAALARDVRGAIEVIESECASLRLVEQALIGLPRVADLGAVGAVSRDLGNAILRIETAQRTLRTVLAETRDFVR